MISVIWRQRLLYLMMSAFLAWHTFAMVVSPVPTIENPRVQSLRDVLHPYAALFKLDNMWDFFAPVGGSTELRYDIQDSAGKTHSFVPTRGLNWFHPRYIWFRDWFSTVLEDPDGYGEFTAAYFCRQHADLRPTRIALVWVQQRERFQPADRLQGKDPLDSQFISLGVLKSYPCQS